MALASEEGPQAHAASAAATIRNRMSSNIVALPVAGVVMVREQVAAEVAGEIAPHRVGMVGPILRVIEFNQEGIGLHAVVVRVAPFHAPCPGEVDLVAGPLD